MSDDEEGGVDSGGNEGEETGGHDPDAGIFENGFEDADYWQQQQQLAFVAKRRNLKRASQNATAAAAAVDVAAAQKHTKMEADQLFPWSTQFPQDPRLMSVDYVVIDSVTYYCSVSLWALLYRQAKTGEPVM